MGIPFPKIWMAILLLSFTAGGGYCADTTGLFKGIHPAENSGSLKNKALELQEYARKKGLDDKVFFLVDMHIPSGKNRFFVYDLGRDSILLAGMVTQGKGNGPFRITPQFSNAKGSSCTSLGRYKIGKSYQGEFGLAYKLYGLDSTNSNAFARYVVLHSHKSVPDNEVHPYPICQSDGCPTVSTSFLGKLDIILQKREQPVLLYIFD